MWRALALLALLALMLAGCGHLPWSKPSIKAGNVEVSGVKDAGKPATLATSESGESVVLPVGSSIVVTKTEAIPATATEKAQPAIEITEIKPAAETVWTKKASTVKAETGTVDTSVAMKRIDAQESRVLLYAALACVVAACFFVWAHYPTPALACGIAAGAFFLAWKVSGMPDWFWAVGMLAAGVGGAIYLGHERGEQHAKSTLNNNG